jgi:UDP-N-acetylglucosamine transferase subunit ALG13
MGTILSALELGKPLLIMPRRVELGEHRNDHQLATAHRLADLGRVNVAFDETELAAKLDELGRLMPQPRISRSAPDDLLAGLRTFILGQPPVPQTAGAAEAAVALRQPASSTVIP